MPTNPYNENKGIQHYHKIYLLLSNDAHDIAIAGCNKGTSDDNRSKQNNSVCDVDRVGQGRGDKGGEHPKKRKTTEEY